jgi:uncharacterized FAD-dependent dehydrogenase
MDNKYIEFSVHPLKWSDGENIEQIIRDRASWPKNTPIFYRIRKKSIDARKKQVVYRIRVEVSEHEESLQDEKGFTPPNALHKESALVIGFGPAGMFAALRLLELGIKPIILERGKPVRARRRDLVSLFRDHYVHPDSNYCFGEGGAGTFSDGKLYTRSKKRGDWYKVLRILVEHGAKSSILYESQPHIGTNKLPDVVTEIRETILKEGGEIHFEEQLEGVEIKSGKLVSVQTNKRDLRIDHMILCTGHSARDVFELLEKAKVKMAQKPFAVGVRIEHPQEFIDWMQYSCDPQKLKLPPASYKVVQQVQDKGVFSFCMCPGGIIAPAMTGPKEMVVNGWSPSKRNGTYANSGLVVEVNEKDFGSHSVMAGLDYQKSIERKAFDHEKNTLQAPAQRAQDFVQEVLSSGTLNSSYIPGLRSVNLHEILPKKIAEALKFGLIQINKRIKGYLHKEAMLVGVESRTSSPIRIPRDRVTMCHPEVEGLYPCGEGAGYAGGIVSAAIDGMKCAEGVARKMNKLVPHEN